VVAGTVSVEVAFTGDAARVELLADGVIALGHDIEPGEESFVFDWETGTISDGTVSLAGRITSSSGESVDSDAIDVTIDNTAPEVQLLVDRMWVLQGAVDLPVTLVEDHIDHLSLITREETLLDVSGSADLLSLDTSGLADGLYWLCVEAVDQAGNQTLSAEVPVVVVNNGVVAEVDYVPQAMVAVPTDWQTTDYHTRGMIESEPDVTRLLAWLVWDGSAGWDLEFAVGQGICPHRGIKYVDAESDSGEIIIDLPRSELPAEAESRLPDEEQGRDVFPHNDDILTFGSFFGHVAPLSPAEHVSESLPIEIHFVMFR
jgi:hypothetical protein